MATQLLEEAPDTPDIRESDFRPVTEQTGELDSTFLPHSFNRTLSGWELLFYSLIVILSTALVIDLWMILR